MNAGKRQSVARTTWFASLSRTRKYFFAAFWLFLAAFGLFVEAIVSDLLDPNSTPWTTLDKFTWQSNVLLLVFAVFAVFFPDHQFLKTDSFLIATLTYITFTFVGYNFILTFLNGGYTGGAFAIFVNVWTHLVCPLAFAIGGVLKFVWEPERIALRGFARTLATGMVYPTVYLIYLASVPYLYSLATVEGTYSIYGTATNTKDNPAVAWPIIMGMYLVFFPGTFAAYYFAAKKIKAKRRGA